MFEIYSIKYPALVTMILSALHSPEVPEGDEYFGRFIFFNQFAYIDNLPKIIKTCGFTGPKPYVIYFYDKGVPVAVDEGVVVPNRKIDQTTGSNIGTIEFSHIKREGRYYLEIPGFGRSGDFQICSASNYLKVLRPVLRSFFLQRCGMDIRPFEKKFGRPACHTSKVYRQDGEPLKFSSGGWHDAGDYGKYTVPGAVSVSCLLSAYEFFPEALSADDLQIPESGNGIPDLLDEAAYELDWLLTMQRDDGGVYHKLTTKKFAAFIPPQLDTAPLYMSAVSTCATADFAAVMAQASRVFRRFDPQKSGTYLAAAEKAYQYLLEHSDLEPAGGFKNRGFFETGEYGDSCDRDERFWAAAELFKTTGDRVYHRKIEELLDGLPYSHVPVVMFNKAAVLGFFACLSAEPGLLNSSLAALIKEKLSRYIRRLVAIADRHGFGVHLANANDYQWGSNGAIARIGYDLALYGHLFAGDEKERSDLLARAWHNLNYLLGLNIHNISFITGVGLRYPRNLHLRSLVGCGGEIMPGFLAGGPNGYRQDLQIRLAMHPDTPPARVYVDMVKSYSTNEVAVNWNAPLVALLACFSIPQKFTPPEKTLSVAQKPPVLPAGLVVSVQETDRNHVKLTWQKPEFEVRGYYVYRDGWSLGFTVENSIIDKKVLRGHTYRYWVTALTMDNHETSPSAPVKAAIPLCGKNKRKLRFVNTSGKQKHRFNNKPV